MDLGSLTSAYGEKVGSFLLSNIAQHICAMGLIRTHQK